MTKKYATSVWKFDEAEFSRAINRAINEVGIPSLAYTMDVSQSAVSNWASGSWAEGFRYPNVYNFVKFCNAMNIHPQTFFTTEEL